ncbi:trypsin-like peptidase domain-containing protein [Nonomuraea sp. NPDC059194]|uniref:trypsin-like peptidase domain-containing protein n=1 Tax=Nonomuraea sp. NPDC059194 TaxID=3346764 RepID=UPI0036A44064
MSSPGPTSRTWVATVLLGQGNPSPIGSAVVISTRRVLTCAHVVAGTGPYWVKVPFSIDARDFTGRVVGIQRRSGSSVEDIAVLELDADLPPDVRPAALRCVKDVVLKDVRWVAYGFPEGDPLATQASGLVGAEAGYGWVTLHTDSRYQLEHGFSGAGLWSDAHDAVVGLIGQKRQGDGRALTLYEADRILPEEKLGLLATMFRAEQAGELAMASWGWALTEDIEGDRHWRPRARGVSRDDERGNRFRGRKRALQRITGWLGGSSPDNHVLIVTGSPGAGKSAVLGRVVTTADPVLREELPDEDDVVKAPAGSVACAVHAKSKSAIDVANEIGRAAGVGRFRRVDELVPALRDRLSERPQKNLNIVVDALDEAATPAEARNIITDVILPVAQASLGIKVLVGTRRDLLSLFGTATEIIDLDKPLHYHHQDLVDYALATLQLQGDERPSNPYHDDDAARSLANKIAEEADKNFLIAGLVARVHGLYDSEPMDPEDLSFSPTVDEALHEHLARIPPVAGLSAKQLFTALAFARAPGITLELWLEAVRTLYDFDKAPALHELSRFAHSSAANFLVESNNGYRLFHQALDEALRPTPQDELAITRAFIAYGKRVGWASAPDYLLRSLAPHAQHVGLVDTLLGDHDFLLHAELLPMLHAIRHAPPPEITQRAILPRWRAVASPAMDMADRRRLLRLTPQAISASPGERQAMFSITETLDRLGDTFRNLPTAAPFRARWASAQPRVVDAVLAGHGGEIATVCTLQSEIGLLLAAAGTDGRIQLWDPITGTHLRELAGHHDQISAACAVRIGEYDLLATGGEDNVIRVWDPSSGAVVRTLRPQRGWITSICAYLSAGVTRLVVGCYDSVALWDPVAERQTGELGRGWVTATCAFVHTGSALIAAGGSDGRTRVWDPISGQLVSECAGQSHVNAICAFSEGERVWLATAGTDKKITIWNPLDGTKKRGIFEPDAAISLCWVHTEEGPLLAAGCEDRKVHLLDPSSGARVQTISGHTDRVAALCPVPLDDRVLVASAGADRSVRLWSPDQHDRQTDAEPEEVTGLCVGFAADRSSLATVSCTGVRLRSTVTGEVGATLVEPSGGRITATAPFHDGFRHFLGTGSSNGYVRLWDPVGECLKTLRAGAFDVTALTQIIFKGVPLLAAGSYDGRVRLWNPYSGTLRHELKAHSDRVTSLAAVVDDDGPLLASGSIDGSLRFWDLDTGRPRSVLRLRADVSAIWPLTIADQTFFAISHDCEIELRGPAPEFSPISLIGHASAVTATCVVTTQAGRAIATGSSDRTVRLWEPTSGALLRVIPVQHEVHAICEVPGGLAVGLSAGLLVLELA